MLDKLSNRRLPVLSGLTLLISLATSASADFVISNHAPDIAYLTGQRGDRTSSAMELSRGKAGTALTLVSRNNISCGIALEGRKLGVNANYETERLQRCDGGKGSSKTRTLDARAQNHIVGFRVCTSRDTPVRIGGFEIATRQIDDRGLAKGSADTIRTTGSGCDRWGNWSSCQDEFVVTGFVARFDTRERGSDLPDALVGLQAVCRQVIVN